MVVADTTAPFPFRPSPGFLTKNAATIPYGTAAAAIDPSLQPEMR